MSRVILASPPTVDEQRALLLAHPCPMCSQIRLLDVDADGLVGATCVCGEDAGACERWSLVALARDLGLATLVVRTTPA